MEYAQSSNALCFGDEKLKNASLIEIELHKCMPIPTSDTPYEDILEFKLKRKDEYTAFKAYIGDLYLEILNSKDVPRSKVNVLNKLEVAIEDINRVTSESFMKKIYKSFSLNLNPENLTTHGLAGMGAATLFGFPVQLGAAAGSLLGAVNLNITQKPVPEVLNKDQKGLAYLVEAQDILKVKPERNELCPCGSGKKYKKCCRA